MVRLWSSIIAVVAALSVAAVVEAFQPPSSPVLSFGGIHKLARSAGHLSQLRSEKNDETTMQEKDKVEVEVGSKEYMRGFLSSPIQDESVTARGSGLEQALKLGGGVAVVLILLVLGFLASNGLI